jgi:hypothetical protein
MLSPVMARLVRAIWRGTVLVRMARTSRAMTKGAGRESIFSPVGVTTAINDPANPRSRLSLPARRSNLRVPTDGDRFAALAMTDGSDNRASVPRLSAMR